MKIKMLVRCLLTPIFALCILNGCATVDQKIGLTYTPLDRPLGQQNGEIAVSRIDPPQGGAKNSKGELIVGSLNNVHGVHQADIISDRTLGEWITDALLTELRRAGFTVTYAAPLPTGVARGVVISEIKAFMQVNKGTVTDQSKYEITFNIDIMQNNVKVKTFSVASRDNSKIISTSREATEKVMLQSLQDTMQQVLPEILQQFGKK